MYSLIWHSYLALWMVVAVKGRPQLNYQSTETLNKYRKANSDAVTFSIPRYEGNAAKLPSEKGYGRGFKKRQESPQNNKDFQNRKSSQSGESSKLDNTYQGNGPLKLKGRFMRYKKSDQQKLSENEKFCQNNNSDRRKDLKQSQEVDQNEKLSNDKGLNRKDTKDNFVALDQGNQNLGDIGRVKVGNHNSTFGDSDKGVESNTSDGIGTTGEINTARPYEGFKQDGGATEELGERQSKDLKQSQEVDQNKELNNDKELNRKNTKDTFGGLGPRGKLSNSDALDGSGSEGASNLKESVKGNGNDTAEQFHKKGKLDEPRSYNEFGRDDQIHNFVKLDQGNLGDIGRIGQGNHSSIFRASDKGFEGRTSDGIRTAGEMNTARPYEGFKQDGGATEELVESRLSKGLQKADVFRPGDRSGPYIGLGEGGQGDTSEDRHRVTFEKLGISDLSDESSISRELIGQDAALGFHKEDRNRFMNGYGEDGIIPLHFSLYRAASDDERLRHTGNFGQRSLLKGFDQLVQSSRSNYFKGFGQSSYSKGFNQPGAFYQSSIFRGFGQPGGFGQNSGSTGFLQSGGFHQGGLSRRFGRSGVFGQSKLSKPSESSRNYPFGDYAQSRVDQSRGFGQSSDSKGFNQPGLFYQSIIPRGFSQSGGFGQKSGSTGSLQSGGSSHGSPSEGAGKPGVFEQIGQPVEWAAYRGFSKPSKSSGSSFWGIGQTRRNWAI